MLGIPNKSSAAFLRQAGIYKADIDAIAAALAGDGVLSGLGVSAQGSPDMTVAVAAGLIRVGGFFCFVSAVSALTIAAADATNPRIDLVVVDQNGTVSRVAGTAAAKPVSPDVPASSVFLAQVYVPAAAANIQTTYIYDRRPVVPDFFDYSEDFLASNLSATAATAQGSVGGAFGLNIAASGTLAAPASQANTGNNPGILRTSTGATSGNNTQLSYNANHAWGRVARARFVVSIPTITTMAAKFGFGQSINDAASSSLGTDGAFFEFVPATSANWAVVTRQASTSTRNASGTAVTAGNWYQLDIIRKQNGNVQFLLNNALLFEHSTNLPATGASISLGTLTHTLTTAARNVDHDFIGINFAPISQRWT